jgi:thiamine kinase-like enzyme
MQSLEILTEAARLLRRFHDLTQELTIPPDAIFQLPVDPRHPWEVICHNDFAPYNCVFRDQHLVGIIDFDTAGPGTRLWDIAYAVYRFAPLAHDEHCRDLGWNPIPDRAARLRLFCDAYGLKDRSALVETVIARLEALVEHLRRTASTPEHLPLYLRDLEYLRENRVLFERALTPGPSPIENDGRGEKVQSG